MSEAAIRRRLPLLDARLRCAADLVPHCSVAADIGADHGRLACYLLSNNICDRMIVSDISADSLAKSKRLLMLHGLDRRAKLVVADGLDAINEPVDAVVIAGMGGRTIAAILRNYDKIGDARLIVSAHTEMHLLRQKLYEYGFCFESETVVRANGRFYTVLLSRRGRAEYSPRQLFTGIELRGECVTEYLQWRYDVEAARRDDMSQVHLKWLKEEVERENGNKSNNI
ncbi:MAG: class I SAM-dependent methyltransferase [Eubacteriales bacterium]